MGIVQKKADSRSGRRELMVISGKSWPYSVNC